MEQAQTTTLSPAFTTQKKQDVKAVWEFIANLTDERVTNVQVYWNNIKVTYTV